MKSLFAFVVFLCAFSAAVWGWADTSSGDPVGVQNQSYSFVDGGISGPYVDETLTIDLFWNKVSMIKFDAEKDASAVLVITRLTPGKAISWGFVGINDSLFRLDDFLAGPDTVFVRDVRLGKNNHVFTHLFGESGASLRIQVLPPLPAIMSFTVTPDRVTAGRSAILSWSAVQADTVVIEPGIGSVGPEGSVQVTPDAATVYTLTAANGYGSTSASVQLEVLYPPELVITEPDGQGDTTSGSFVISWTDEDPDSNAAISLFYDTDSTGGDGTLITAGLTEDPDGPDDQFLWNTASLAPGAYYVYAVIDDCRNDSAVAYSSGPVTVAAVAAPTVSIIAAPESIAAGGSATLSWTSTDASSCLIEPDVGAVAVNGSKSVTPAATTVYTITATGPGGMATDSATVQVDCPLTVAITCPEDGATVSGPWLSVRGTVTHAGNKETGVTVNGVLAIISDGQFRADHVPLNDGENSITVSATDVDGATTGSTITITVDTSGDYIALSADPASGILPYETTLRIYGSFGFTSSSLICDGPGSVEVFQISAEEYRVQVDTEGVYTFTATVTDNQGNAFTDSMVAESLSKEKLDGLLRDKWTGLKTALMTGDKTGALKFQHGTAQERYAAIYNALGSDLPMLAGQMRPIAPVVIEGSRAKYRTTQDHLVEGRAVTITYYVYFSRDQDGIWKIEMY